MNLQDVFNIVVVIFTVTNIGALGLETNLREALKHLYSIRAIGLILLWGWMVGPALAFLLIWLLPLAPGHAAGLLLISLAPTAPFFPLMVSKARGDMSFAASFMILTTVSVVLLLPLMAPWLIEGLMVDSWSLAKPLLTLVLLPLVFGVAIRQLAPNAGIKLFPVFKKIGMLFLLITLVLTLVLYGREMLDTVGSFAPGAQVLFFVAITVLSYTIHFGLTQQQRSVMALGMCTRNIAAVFAAFFGITNPLPGMFVMVVLVVPLAAIVAVVAARLFAKLAGETAEEDSNIRFFLVGLKALFVANHTTDSLDTIKQRLASKEAVLIDVREPNEWEDGHLEAAKLVPLSDIRYSQKRKVATKDLSKKEIIYCHCRSGKRVLIATDYLSKDGYDIRPLKQGYKDLLSAGFEKATNIPSHPKPHTV